MRLPNGFGSVYKLTGHRRRPWVVKKTVEGRQKALGYFETHDEALTFLLKINHEPHGLTATFADITSSGRPASGRPSQDPANRPTTSLFGISPGCMTRP